MKKKYVAFGSSVIVLTLTGEIIKLYFSGFSWQMSNDKIVWTIWMAGLGLVSNGPPVFCGLFISIKMLKTWYVKEEEKLILVKENANAELQLLKAQIHPHFLFNTLNNIYSFALDKSPKAPELVLKLSAVIKYMINDCEAALVSVEKEIKMIKDYIGLEKVRYGNHLDLQVHIRNDHTNILIAPFLLIPFIENSFKHGASQILSRPWIKLTLEVNSDHLYFELSNSKPNEIPELNAKKGIGLRNVEKRLQLLYPENHELTVMNEETQFTVVMRVSLKDTRPQVAVHEAMLLQDALPTFS
jgi:LytS/YehU family sensor histidine kinase